MQVRTHIPRPILAAAVRPMPRIRAVVPRMRVAGMGTTYGGPCNWSDDYCNSSASLANPASWPCCLWVDAANLASGTRGLVSNALTPSPVLNLTAPPTVAPPTAAQIAAGDPTLPAQLSAAQYAAWVAQMQGDVANSALQSECAGVLSLFDSNCPGDGSGGWGWLLLAGGVLVAVELFSGGGRK